MKKFIGILSLVLSLTLMVGCASDFVSSGSGSSSAPSDSSSDSVNQTMQMVNQQMAVDAANAAAQQQFNDAMAAQQLNENQHNDEFNRGLDLHQ
jgi:Tfp pilus tip-associated adhesin PilY1